MFTNFFPCSQKSKLPCVNVQYFLEKAAQQDAIIFESSIVWLLKMINLVHGATNFIIEHPCTYSEGCEHCVLSTKWGCALYKMNLDEERLVVDSLIMHTKSHIIKPIKTLIQNDTHTRSFSTKSW